MQKVPRLRFHHDRSQIKNFRKIKIFELILDSFAIPAAMTFTSCKKHADKLKQICMFCRFVNVTNLDSKIKLLFLKLGDNILALLTIPLEFIEEAWNLLN